MERNFCGKLAWKIGVGACIVCALLANASLTMTYNAMLDTYADREAERDAYLSSIALKESQYAQEIDHAYIEQVMRSHGFCYPDEVIVDSNLN